MDSREIVLRAIYFECPPRVPISWAGEGKMSDFAGGGFKLGGPLAESRPDFWQPKVKGEDEWHCVWKRPSTGRTFGEVRGHPLSSWDKLENYEFPQPRVAERFEGVGKNIREAHKKGKYFMGGLGLGFWEIYRGLRGMAAALTDLFLNRERMGRLLDCIVDFYVPMIREYGALGADAVSWADDWGTQTGGMASREMWRDVFKLRYKKWCNAADKHGMQTYFHSCGYIYDYIPDMIEAGTDILNLNQPELLGIDRLAEDFGGKVTFDTNVDLQKTLARGNPDEIEKEAKHIIRTLGSFDGGLILGGWDSDFVAKAEWTLALHRTYTTECSERMHKVYVEYGKYPKRELSHHDRTGRNV